MPSRRGSEQLVVERVVKFFLKLFDRGRGNIIVIKPVIAWTQLVKLIIPVQPGGNLFKQLAVEPRIFGIIILLVFVAIGVFEFQRFGIVFIKFVGIFKIVIIIIVAILAVGFIIVEFQRFEPFGFVIEQWQLLRIVSGIFSFVGKFIVVSGSIGILGIIEQRNARIACHGRRPLRFASSTRLAQATDDRSIVESRS